MHVQCADRETVLAQDLPPGCDRVLAAYADA
jgi:hypothetical protein